MERDLRETPLYREVEEHFRKVYEPGFGRVTEPSDPRPSPDGRWIAFTGSLWEKLEGTAKTRICLAATDRTGHRTITTGPEHDAGARWSPDGRRLSFLSDRKEKGRMQLFVLDVGGVGEADAMPEIEGTVEDHVWSPDGTRILVLAAGLHADSAGAEGSGALEAEKDLPDWVPKVDSWEDALVWRRLWIVDPASGELRRLSRDGLNAWETDWCGNDQVIAVASEDPGESSWYAAALVTIDAATGDDRVLATSDVQFGIPAGSPDGSFAAVLEAPCSDRQLVSGRAVIVDVASGERRVVEVPDSDVTWIGWRSDTRLAYAALRRGSTILGDIDPRTGERTEAWSTAEAVGVWEPSAAAVGEDGFAFVRQGFDRPLEVALVERGVDRTVASFRHEGHDHARSLVGRAERLTWTAPDGLEVDGFLLAPAGEGPHPLILNVHGGPVWSFAEWFPRPNLAWLVSRGYAILMPTRAGPPVEGGPSSKP